MADAGLPRRRDQQSKESFTSAFRLTGDGNRPQDGSKQFEREKRAGASVNEKISRFEILIFTAGNPPEGQQ
jgi:hypothetical protein